MVYFLRPSPCRKRRESDIQRTKKNPSRASELLYLLSPNHILDFRSAFRASRRTNMALSGAVKKPAAAAKTKRPVTLKHLAAKH